MVCYIFLDLQLEQTILRIGTLPFFSDEMNSTI